MSACKTQANHNWYLSGITGDGATKRFKCHDCGEEVFWGYGADDTPVGPTVPVTTDNPMAGLLDNPAEEER